SAWPRNEPWHQIDAWQKVRVGDDLVARPADLFVIECRKVRRDVFFRESTRPTTGAVVHPYRLQLLARLAEGVVVPRHQRADRYARSAKGLHRRTTRFDRRTDVVELLQ